MIKQYNAKEMGGEEEEAMMAKYRLQKEDAKLYFTSVIKPQLDRAYKIYIAYAGDRAKEIQSWQANVSVPYPQAVVETLMPRILDARPEFAAQGRNENDQLKSEKIQKLCDYDWEISKMDDATESLVRSSLVYGTGFLQVSWKRDEREYKFLNTKDLGKKKYTWKKKTQMYYDGPFAEWVDNYDLWYDWHNIPRQSKQFWFRRKVLTGDEIKRRYPRYDKIRLDMAFASGNSDLTDYASIRNETKKVHEKNTAKVTISYNSSGEIYQSQNDPDLKMHEVFEWTRPFDDAYAVMVNDIPILKDGMMPIIYDFKEASFIEFPYLKLPNEFEGVGLPILLESPTSMLNLIKNQRLDAATLSIHKMWIVNPLANINKAELVSRPFGIIYSTDPSGVREVQFSDIKPSSYREEELLKGDMRYASGVDDFSMGVGGGAASATEVRHLRESTLERVRLFINHLGSGFSDLMRYWISMRRQFFSAPITIRITGEDGIESFPLIEKDDLMGYFDFKAAVNPSIAGKNDVDKKQGMDLFQLLAPMNFIDPRKLTSKILHSWNWSLESIAKKDQQEGLMGMENGAPPVESGLLPPSEFGQIIPEESNPTETSSAGDIPPEVIAMAMAKLGVTPPSGNSQFSEASLPINLARMPNVLPPTVAGIKGNPRGLNRKLGGRVNTEIPSGKAGNGTEAQLLNRASSLQRKK